MKLFPPSVKSLIKSDDLCMVINEVVKTLDLSCLYKKVSAEGNPTYHPAMMFKVYFYSYAKGIFNSRKIAQALKENITFIFLTAWQRPDFRTISDFGKNNLKDLGMLFPYIENINSCNTFERSHNHFESQMMNLPQSIAGKFFDKFFTGVIRDVIFTSV